MARSVLGWSESPGPSAAGLSGDAAVSKRVTAEIPSLEARRARTRRLPRTESELIELLKRDGSVLFSDEAPGAGGDQVFSLGEVGVIVVPAP